MENRVKSVQTVNNSSGNASNIKNKQVTANKAIKAGFSETPIVYTVKIDGKDCHGTEYSITKTYEEYHPLMALGRAVVEFQKAIIVGSIEHILVCERVISNR